MTPQAQAPRIWWDVTISAYRLASPFNAMLVDMMKTKIPISDRSYDASTKIWTFTERYLDFITKFFSALKVTPVVITRAASERAHGSSPSTKQAAPIEVIIAEFVRTCPFEAMQKAYRHAALLLHPDRGGDMTKMSTLNAAWERIQKEVYQQ